jgi:hypothetical protein
VTALVGGITETGTAAQRRRVLPGSDPVLRNTYVVFSAHIDHTGDMPARLLGHGMGDPSATAPMTTRPARRHHGARRSVRGAARGAEALHHVPRRQRRGEGPARFRVLRDNPTVPIESIVANINIDMIGRNNPDSVVVIGQTTLRSGRCCTRSTPAPGAGMTVSDDLWPEQRFFFRSDHFSFARREVPAIFFFTGVHEDYHRPSDTVDKIDLDKITRITRLVFHYGMAIANDAERPAVGSGRPRRGPPPRRAQR